MLSQSFFDFLMLDPHVQKQYRRVNGNSAPPQICFVFRHLSLSQHNKQPLATIRSMLKSHLNLPHPRFLEWYPVTAALSRTSPAPSTTACLPSRPLYQKETLSLILQTYLSLYSGLLVVLVSTSPWATAASAT